jgi:hypothetical protein
MTDPVAGLAKRFSHTAVEDDPVEWVKNKLDIDLYSKQREILRLLEKVPKLAVPSCHNAGKSFTAALAAARWLAKYPPGTARVISTAPSDSQVRAILWNEIGQLKERAGPRCPAGSIRRSGGSGRTWPGSAASRTTTHRAPSRACTPSTFW